MQGNFVQTIFESGRGEKGGEIGQSVSALLLMTSQRRNNMSERP